MDAPRYCIHNRDIYDCKRCAAYGYGGPAAHIDKLEARVKGLETELQDKSLFIFEMGGAHAELLLRAEKAEARLAELVHRAREWNRCVNEANDGREELDSILDKYEGGEHG